MTDLPEVRAYRDYLSHLPVSLDHHTHFSDCGCKTALADAAINALESALAHERDCRAAMVAEHGEKGPT